MADCCEDKACAIDVIRERQGGTLRIVLAINAGMFLIVLAAGLVAGSSALLADSLDNLGDALTYALSLYAVARTARTKARVALFKGFLILAAGIFVVGQVVYKLLHPAVPIFEAMGMIAILALVGNGACLALLWKHRHEDVNMSSVWECSRNDIASNLAVLVAAAGVWLTATQWPDLVVGALLAGLFLASGARVLRSALKASRDSGQPVTIRLAR